LRESDKHFLIALVAATGIILFWKGIWEGVGSLPFLEQPWMSLAVGLAILVFSGVFFREFDPLGGLEKSVLKVIHSVHTHPRKEEFTIKYHDAVKRKDIEIQGHKIKKIEQNILSVHEKGREIFVPIHRIRCIHRKGEEIWKK